MVIVVILLGLGASFLHAASAVLQRQVIGQPSPQQLFSRDIVRRILRNRKWFVGLGLSIIAFLCQAAAFYFGTLVMVAPLLTTDLIFLLVILHFGKHVAAGPREWGAVVAICGGLSGLLIALHPHRAATITIQPLPWAITLGSLIAIMAVCAFVAVKLGSRQARAGLLGIAAGLSYALVASCVKLTGHEAEQGFLHMLISWPLYALIVAGAISVALQQNTYGAGPLAVSQPAMETTELVGEIALGVILFNEIVHSQAATVAGGSISGLVIIAGIILLGGSKRMYQSKI